MSAGASAINNWRSSIVYNSYGARLFRNRPARISEYAKEKTTEQNLIVGSGTFEAKVTNIALDVLYYWT